MPALRIKRGSRSAIDTAAGSSGLAAGEPYLITDEARLAVGTAAGAYAAMAKEAEVRDPRVLSTTSASSLTPATATYDEWEYTALAAGLTINAPTGSPSDGRQIMFRVKATGSDRTLTWNAAFVAIGVTLPASAPSGKWVYVGAKWNAGASKWHVLAVAAEA